MITLYSKPYCPFCVSAKTWLEHHAIPFKTVDVMEDANALAFIKGQGHKTVPQLYVGDVLLVDGGFTGMHDLGVQALVERVNAAAPV